MGLLGKGYLILKGEIEFSKEKRTIVCSRDLEDIQMSVFSRNRATCREGPALGGEGVVGPPVGQCVYCEEQKPLQG